MSSNPDNIESQQDQEDDRRRPVLIIPAVIIIALCALISSVYAVTQGVVNIGGTQEPTQEEPTATEEETEVAEVPTRTPTFTAVPTDEPTDEPTPTATPTDVPTEEPTDEPTPTDTPVRRTTVTITPTDEPECGDLVCNGTETRTSCPQDCGCYDLDGICTVAETAIGTCFDCTNPGTCDHACSATVACATGYTCNNGFCDASHCDPPPPTEEPAVTCTCDRTVCDDNCDCNAFISCSDGTTSTQYFYCEDDPPTICQPPEPKCSCKGSDLYCDGELSQPEDPQCLEEMGCSCTGWSPGQFVCDGFAFYDCNPNDNVSYDYVVPMTCDDPAISSCGGPGG